MTYCQSEPFVVEGGIVIADATNPSPEAGTIIWNGNDFLGWDGTQWNSLTLGLENHTAPHLNQPTSLSQGLAWTSVAVYEAHYSDNGDAVIFWQDSGNWYLSKYLNGQWSHPYSSSQAILYNSSDMNASGQILFTYESGTNIIVEEVTNTGTSVLGQIPTGTTNSNPKITLNDRGDFFISFFKTIGGQNHVHVVDRSMMTPFQISTYGTSASQHLITCSENGDAVIFWSQEKTINGDIGLYRSEYNGASWASPPGLQNTIDYAESPYSLKITDLVSSTDGQFLLLYDLDEENIGFADYYISHKIIEKRNSIWRTQEMMTSNTSGMTDSEYYDIAVSMSDNGQSNYSYTEYNNDLFTASYGLWKYDHIIENWSYENLGLGHLNYLSNDISNSKEIIACSLLYCGNRKLYLSLDGFKPDKLPNINEGIGLDGSQLGHAQVNVNNSGSYLTTWLQDSKLMYMIN